MISVLLSSGASAVGNPLSTKNPTGTISEMFTRFTALGLVTMNVNCVVDPGCTLPQSTAAAWPSVMIVAPSVTAISGTAHWPLMANVKFGVVGSLVGIERLPVNVPTTDESTTTPSVLDTPGPSVAGMPSTIVKPAGTVIVPTVIW